MTKGHLPQLRRIPHSRPDQNLRRRRQPASGAPPTITSLSGSLHTKQPASMSTTVEPPLTLTGTAWSRRRCTFVFFYARHSKDQHRDWLCLLPLAKTAITAPSSFAWNFDSSAALSPAIGYPPSSGHSTFFFLYYLFSISMLVSILVIGLKLLWLGNGSVGW